MINTTIDISIISRIIFGAAIIIGIGSCSKDWIEVKTDISLVIPESLGDCQALLDNSSKMNSSSPALGTLGADEYYITESTWQTSFDDARNAYSWSHNAPYITATTGEWHLPYERILYCNIVLEALEKINPISGTGLKDWNDIKGQALFHRAKSFFEIAEVYAPPYDSTTSNNTLGIPLRLESDINIASIRSTMKNTYAQILDDLHSATKILPIFPKYKTRASKIAVYAELARVYISMCNYDMARNYSDSCLQHYNAILDFNSLSASNTFPIERLNNEVIFHSTLLNFSFIGASARISDSVYNLYGPHDLRKSIFFRTSAGLRVFRGSYNGSNVKFNGLATDEQYLIRAECYARSGRVPEAMADLNHLLRNRWDSSRVFVPIVATNADDALRIILEERRKELLFRGLRWSDLRRLNRDSRFAVTLTRTIAGQTYTLEPSSYKYTFPIPDDIIEMTGMQQNPGWK